MWTGGGFEDNQATWGAAPNDSAPSSSAVSSSSPVDQQFSAWGQPSTAAAAPSAAFRSPLASPTSPAAVPSMNHTPTASNTPVSPSATPSRPKLCKFYASGGGCARGDDCPFSHDLTVRASTMAAAQAGFVFVSGVANIGGAANVESPEERAAHMRDDLGNRPGLNPTAKEYDFQPPYALTDDDLGYVAAEHDAHNNDENAPGAADDACAPGQAYFGASSHLVGKPQLPTASGPSDVDYDGHHGYEADEHHHGNAGRWGSGWQQQQQQQRDDGYHDHRYQQQQQQPQQYHHGGDSGYYSNAATPPTFTQRRRIAPYGSQPSEGPLSMDYATRQSQAMRPPLELSTKTANRLGTTTETVDPAPSARPRPGGSSNLAASHHHDDSGAAGSEHFVPWQGFH